MNPLPKKDAFVELWKEYNEHRLENVYTCYKETVVQPIQKSDMDAMLSTKDRDTQFYETNAEHLHKLFSNHLALNFSFISDGNIKADITERQPQIDFGTIRDLRRLLDDTRPGGELLRKAFNDAMVRLSLNTKQ